MQNEKTNRNPRLLAAQIISRWLTSGDFPNRLLSVIPRDRAFITEIVQGVVRWKRSLEWVIKQTARHVPPPPLKSFLLTGLYQLLMMDKAADYAVVNETVGLTKEKFSSKQADFVNAVLRRAIRDREKILTAIKQRPSGIRYSHPDLLIHRWRKFYGPANVLRLCEWNNTRPDVIIRINNLKPADQVRAFVSQLRQKGIRPANNHNNYYPLPHGLQLEDLPGYADGLFLVMDPFASGAVELLNPQPGERVLDACAAPGGKTFLIAEKMGGRGELDALDVSEDRLRIMKANFQRLQILDFVKVKKYNIMEIETYPTRHIATTKSVIMEGEPVVSRSRIGSAQPRPPTSPQNYHMLKRNDPKVVCHSRLARESRGNENQYLDSRLHGNDRGDTGNLRGEIYDRILADVPCSNTGVIRRKPDIRWRFSLKGLGLLVKTQKKMLDRLVPLLKTGGTLVYSTCSLEPEENQLLVESWLKANPSFRLVAERKYFPPVSGTDGGYAAVILKK